ncbi:class I SAM-dependent methyltransferase [Fulvivirga sp. RKSG066]|uniref:class I SAM-dependent methyltransferase n=1 Tax=Fulvivirga aurantia TaxID=2529383 RepID=UPI0012BD7766|nr:class I SAM-dependent methyltransferase [Fulvivirga aurantia]MTI20812.1 class I SAM-dependent methyltransferase [Fulvivirga aurantia]
MKTFLKKKLVSIHQKSSHVNRTTILSKEISEKIKDMPDLPESISCLDVGCGDLKLSGNIINHLPKTEWYGIDVFEPKDKSDPKWKRFKFFDGKHIPFDDNQFDIVLFSDVLHHADEDVPKLLQEAKRVSKYIIIKDHFEYGFVSRQFLRLMDFIGNWGYDVNIPKRYFTEAYFRELCETHTLQILSLQKGVALYDHLPIINKIAQDKWQFIAVLKGLEVDS